MMSLRRREALVVVIGAAVAVAGSRLAFGQSVEAAAPFQLDPLPYPTNRLEPFVDSLTLSLHHDKHHAAYVNNLNMAAKEFPQLAQIPVERLLANLEALPENVRTTVRHNLGGHVNHTMYWQVMGPTGTKPDGEVLAAIDRDFGGLDKLQIAFDAAGGRVFGSGWVFVTIADDGKLAIETRPNEDTPLMDGRRVLFGNDVWEHSHYLTYKNRRPDFLRGWWNVLNWPKVGERFAQARRGTLVI
jgi:superoxide dismutase, Fe-Mn family